MRSIFHLIILSLLFCSCGQSEKKVADSSNVEVSILNTDPVKTSSNSSAKSIPFIFKSRGENVLGRILMAPDSGAKPTIVFLHGNPGIEKNEDIGQALRRVGYNAVYFSYVGTWGNKGIFSYKESIKDVSAITDYLVKHSKSLRVDVGNIYICGFSMGADIAILNASTNANIKGVISIDPWNGYCDLKNKSDKQRQAYENALLIRPCVNIPSGKQFVSEIIENENMSLSSALNTLSKPIIHIFSKKKGKNSFSKNCESAKSQEMVVLNAYDHSFSDKRILLTNTIYEWLKKH